MTTIETRIAKNGSKRYYVRDENGKLSPISKDNAEQILAGQYFNNTVANIEEETEMTNENKIAEARQATIAAYQEGINIDRNFVVNIQTLFANHATPKQLDAAMIQHGKDRKAQVEIIVDNLHRFDSLGGDVHCFDEIKEQRCAASRAALNAMDQIYRNVLVKALIKKFDSMSEPDPTDYAVTADAQDAAVEAEIELAGNNNTEEENTTDSKGETGMTTIEIKTVASANEAVAIINRLNYMHCGFDYASSTYNNDRETEYRHFVTGKSFALVEIVQSGKLVAVRFYNLYRGITVELQLAERNDVDHGYWNNIINVDVEIERIKLSEAAKETDGSEDDADTNEVFRLLPDVNELYDTGESGEQTRRDKFDAAVAQAKENCDFLNEIAPNGWRITPIFDGKSLKPQPQYVVEHNGNVKAILDSLSFANVFSTDEFFEQFNRSPKEQFRINRRREMDELRQMRELCPERKDIIDDLIKDSFNAELAL